MVEHIPAADTRLLEQRGGISFLECLTLCTSTPELVHQWERLSGKKLTPSSPIEAMIDKTTGYDLVLMGEFADFVYEQVFSTMPER